MDYTVESLGGGVEVCVSAHHRFGIDAFLLADFAAPRRRDFCCDLGAGCGIVGALWLRAADAAPRMVWAVEVQEEAIELMRQSVRAGGLPAGRFVPVQADLRALAGTAPAGAFDLVACNPPYKPAGTGILSDDASDRIARHETMCGLGDVCDAGGRMLRFGGRMCICLRPERLPDALEAMRRAKLEPKRLRFVQQRADRAPWLFLLEGRRGAKPFLRVEPPLVVEGPGGFSAEILRIYGKEANR